MNDTPSQAATRFRLNEPHVVYEQFETEFVAVNLDTGKYYSMADTATLVWPMLIGGMNAAEIGARLATAFDAEPGAIDAAIRDFTAKLAADDLIVPRADAPADAAIVALPPGPRTAFRAPAIEAFSDMQDLLLLDPVHDVDEAGWPVFKPPAAPLGQ